MNYFLVTFGKVQTDRRTDRQKVTCNLHRWVQTVQFAQVGSIKYLDVDLSPPANIMTSGLTFGNKTFDPDSCNP